MCQDKQKLFWDTNSDIQELIDWTGLFYPETSLPNKYECFSKDDFAVACDRAVKNLKAVSLLNAKNFYSDEHLAERIYDDKNVKIPIQQFFALNMQVIFGIIERKKEQLLNLIGGCRNWQDLGIFSGDFLAFHDILIDVSNFFMEFLQWKGIDTSLWPRASMRRWVSAFEVFGSGCNILRRRAYLNDFSVPPMAIFLLRQAIELKICEILNVSYLCNEKDEIIKVPSDILLSVLSSKYFILPVKKSIIKKIHTWTNEYIHTGNIDWFWKIEFAQHVLQDLFSTNPIFVLESYYTGSLQNNILSQVHGAKKLVTLRSNSLDVVLLDSQKFALAQDLGYYEYKESTDPIKKLLSV